MWRSRVRFSSIAPKKNDYSKEWSFFFECGAKPTERLVGSFRPSAAGGRRSEGRKGAAVDKKATHQGSFLSGTARVNHIGSVFVTSSILVNSSIVAANIAALETPTQKSGCFSYALLLLLYRKKARLAQLFGCKRPHHVSQSLPPFYDMHLRCIICVCTVF